MPCGLRKVVADAAACEQPHQLSQQPMPRGDRCRRGVASMHADWVRGVCRFRGNCEIRAPRKTKGLAAFATKPSEIGGEHRRGASFHARSLASTCFSCPSAFVYFAIPKNTAKHRSTTTSVSVSMRPKGGVSLSRRTVMVLSTMTCEGFVKPFVPLGCRVTRSKGEATSVLVMGSTVALECSAKRSAWITNAGRGLPKSPCRAMVTRSPRIMPSSRPRQLKQHP